MRLLLDTNVVLYWLEGSGRLAPEATRAIEEAEKVYVSILAPWEISIKVALGKLSLQAELIPAIEQSGFEFLGVKPEHGWIAGQLPPLHKDPFDRLLVAQALSEGLVLVTRDRHILRYAIATMPA